MCDFKRLIPLFWVLLFFLKSKQTICFQFTNIQLYNLPKCITFGALSNVFPSPHNTNHFVSPHFRSLWTCNRHHLWSYLKWTETPTILSLQMSWTPQSDTTYDLISNGVRLQPLCLSTCHELTNWHDYNLISNGVTLKPLCGLRLNLYVVYLCIEWTSSKKSRCVIRGINHRAQHFCLVLSMYVKFIDIFYLIHMLAYIDWKGSPILTYLHFYVNLFYMFSLLSRSYQTFPSTSTN